MSIFRVMLINFIKREFWLFLATVIELIIALWLNPVIHDSRLLLREKVSIFSFGVLSFVIFGSLFIVIFLLCENIFKENAKLRLFARALISLFTFLLILFWLSSWGSKVSTNSFLSIESVKFWLPNPIQVIHWVPPYLLVSVPLLSLLLTFFGRIFVNYIIKPRSICSRKLWPTILFLPLSLILIFTFGLPQGNRSRLKVPDTMGDRVYYEGVNISVEKLFTRYLKEESGTLGTVFANLLFHSKGIEFRPDPDIQVIYPKRINAKEFVTAIDLSKVNRYNVIFITIESLRADVLSINGGIPQIMPEVNKLSQESFVFTKCYSQASHSNYADLGPLTSQYPLRSHATHVYPKNPLYPRTPIYDLLKEAGWRTAIISSQNDHWGKVINYLDTGTLDLYLTPENMGVASEVAETDLGFAKWVAKTKHAGSVDDRITINKGIEWIDLNNDPFFLSLNLQTTHFPYSVPKDFKRIFGPEQIDFRMEFNHYPKDKIPIVKALYQDSARYVDDQLGKLFLHLKSTGKWENTIVVLTGDHGQAFYEHGFASHANAIYNEVMRVPLLIKIPGATGKVFDKLVEHVDIPPTVLSILNFPRFIGFQGEDILTSDKPKFKLGFLVAQTPLAHQYGVVSDKYKLIYDMRRESYLSYDLQNDSQENKVLNVDVNEDLQRVKKIFESWVAEQIGYYSNPKRMSEQFPPQIAYQNRN